jgi:hypothetical protein
MRGRELPTQLGEAGSGALSSPLTQQPRKFNYAYQLLVDIFTCCFREMAEPLSMGTGVRGWHHCSRTSRKSTPSLLDDLQCILMRQKPLKHLNPI